MDEEKWGQPSQQNNNNTPPRPLTPYSRPPQIYPPPQLQTYAWYSPGIYSPHPSFSPHQPHVYHFPPGAEIYPHQHSFSPQHLRAYVSHSPERYPPRPPFSPQRTQICMSCVPEIYSPRQWFPQRAVHNSPISLQHEGAMEQPSWIRHPETGTFQHEGALTDPIIDLQLRALGLDVFSISDNDSEEQTQTPPPPPPPPPPSQPPRVSYADEPDLLTGLFDLPHRPHVGRLCVFRAITENQDPDAENSEEELQGAAGAADVEDLTERIDDMGVSTLSSLEGEKDVKDEDQEPTKGYKWERFDQTRNN